MRWLLLPLLAACYTIIPETHYTADPVLHSPSSRPLPDGFFAEPRLSEAEACGPEYVGLDALIARAQADSDALVQMTVDLEHRWTLNGRMIKGRWYRLAGPIGEPYDETRCYVLRGYRASFHEPAPPPVDESPVPTSAEPGCRSDCATICPPASRPCGDGCVALGQACDAAQGTACALGEACK